MDALRVELAELIIADSDSLKKAVGVRGANSRADAITMYCREVLRNSSLCLIDGEVRYFGGRCYLPCKGEELLNVLGNVLIDQGVSPTDVRRIGDMPLAVLSEKTYAAEPLIAFENGVLDLRSGEFVHGFSPEKRVTESLPYAYRPFGTCPRWEAFLGEVMPDEKSRMALQEFFGMVFLDRRSLSVEKMALFVGSGANGKSVIFEVIKRVIGPDMVSTLDAAQLSDEKMIPYLVGKRLNFAPDMARSKDFSSALKALASGQEVTGRSIFKDAVSVKAPPLCFAMNEMPVFRDITDAFFRRVLLFSFDVKIPPEKQDKSLVEKICHHDLPGIFQWVMAGRERLISSGGEFTRSEKMEGDLELLRKDATAGADYPVRAYLMTRGLAVYPQFPGQPAILISRNEIHLGLQGTVSFTAITRELASYGVKMYRSREIKYRVYELRNNK